MRSASRHCHPSSDAVRDTEEVQELRAGQIAPDCPDAAVEAAASPSRCPCVHDNDRPATGRRDRQGSAREGDWIAGAADRSGDRRLGLKGQPACDPAVPARPLPHR